MPLKGKSSTCFIKRCTIKVYGDNEVWLLKILTLGLNGKWVISIRP